jgi:transposase
MVARRRVFPTTFKRDAVQRVLASDAPVGKVATELGVHETVLRRWVAQFSTECLTDLPWRAEPPQSHRVESELVTENARLRTEVEKLKSEREVLKKALAIVFSEMK